MRFLGIDIQSLKFKIQGFMKIFKFILLLVISVFLISCEAFLRFNGNVYNSKNEPISNAKITMIVNKNKIEKIAFDTISSENKSEPQILYTDKNGYFKTRTVLVGCPFGCPKVQLMVEKDKTKKIILMDKDVRRDSMKIILE